MKLIADFHIHSRYSRATSRELRPEEIDYWARIKGLQVVGTGDFTHPAWSAELKEKLEPAEQGLFKLKENFQIKDRLLPANSRPARFVLTSEISCIYKKAGAVRKLHHLILAPGMEAAEAISKKLSRIGNIHSDGRPILGIDSKNLLEIVLESGQGAVMIPAHIWTPWFSLFGSMSGFDAIEECFEELSKEIFALETGLSSDPAMNWRLSALDRFSLVSNSDAHSAKNLAREACMFDCGLDFFSLISALKNPQEGYSGTIEFFPEEGKYHFDGHRKCLIRFSPEETKKNKGICPVCKKPLTIGVMNRVDELADRKEPQKPKSAAGFKSLIPLSELIAEICETGSQSKKVGQEYFRLIEKLGPELDILMDAPINEIEKKLRFLGEAVRRMREGKVIVEAGYDGEYGIIRAFADDELRRLRKGQAGFFAGQEKVKKSKPEKVEELRREVAEVSSEETLEGMLFPGISEAPSSVIAGLEVEQQKAVDYQGRALLIKAGPGTGKTRTLTHRIARLIEKGDAKPEQVIALTFTNQAGEEMRSRLKNLLGEKAENIFIGTFHAFAWKLIKESAEDGANLSIIDQDAKNALLKEIAPDLGSAKLKKISELISRTKMYLMSPEEIRGGNEEAKELAKIGKKYQARLSEDHCLDFDDLILKAVNLLQKPGAGKAEKKFCFVDEFQDLDFAEYQMVKLLVGETGSVCAIGDPNQAIYGFRGASPEFFARFKEDFPDAEIIALQKSFRSSDQILKASAEILAGGETVELRSGIAGAKLRIIELPTEAAEAEFVVSEIEKLVGGTGFFSFDSSRVKSGAGERAKSFSDFAVLFRASSQAKALVEAFSRSGIPYRLLSESPLRSKFFRTGVWTLNIISGKANALIMRLALKEIFKKTSGFPKAQADLKKWLKQKNDERASILLHLLENAHELSAIEICEKIFSLADADDDEASEKEMVKELVIDLVRRKADQYGIRSPEQMLEILTMAGSQDFYDPHADRVPLLTIHSAKGLEFDVVFVVGCEEGLIPHISSRSAKELEEEKRLFYVALTRAKSMVYLSRAKKRLIYGAMTKPEPSRFLLKIKQELLDQLKSDPLPVKPKKNQLDLF